MAGALADTLSTPHRLPCREKPPLQWMRSPAEKHYQGTVPKGQRITIPDRAPSHSIHGYTYYTYFIASKYLHLNRPRHMGLLLTELGPRTTKMERCPQGQRSIKFYK